MFGSRSVRFNPQLEELGVRITPSIKGGATGDFGHVTVVAAISPADPAGQLDGSKPGVGSGSNAEVTHGIWVGPVEPFSIKPGGGEF